jgi:glycosyltransferase involved in cell wall biosynthesis
LKAQKFKIFWGFVANSMSCRRGLPKMTRYLVFRSDATTVCGVESFARNLAHRLGTEADSRVLDLRGLPKFLEDVDGIVLNFPIVAWKKRLLEPLVVSLLAKLRRKKITVVLHEWASLDWKRRLVLWPVVRLADALLFSAPEIEREWVQSRLSGRRRTSAAIIPIPPNLLPTGEEPTGPASLRIRDLRKGGRKIIGQFGSIYPKKNCVEMLDIARALKDGGDDVSVAFIGSFIKGLDDVEDDFFRQVEERDLGDRILVTGYLATEEEVFAACREVDVFCYSFAEGLTSRRGSVLAAALSGRFVVTNGPADPSALDHHGLFLRLIESGNIVICPPGSDIEAMAERVHHTMGKTPPPLDVSGEIARLWQAIIATLDAV